MKSSESLPILRILDQLILEYVPTDSIIRIMDVAREVLKEQDRDTRHACAEAVHQCPEDTSGECIWKTDAHAACMNAGGDL